MQSTQHTAWHIVEYMVVMTGGMNWLPQGICALSPVVDIFPTCRLSKARVFSMKEEKNEIFSQIGKYIISAFVLGRSSEAQQPL